MQPTVQPATLAGAPNAERPASRRCRCGAEIPLEAARCRRGHPAPGLPGPALQHGAFSLLVQRAATPEQGALADLLRTREAAIVADLGGRDTLSTLKINLVPRVLALSATAEWLEADLFTQGFLTAKGRQRAALTAYLQVVDRLLRVSVVLGLDRRPKPIDPFEAIERAVDEVSE